MVEKWKEIFRSVELQFFQRKPGEWLAVVNSTLSDLDLNYDARHPAHVFVLNKHLRLDPPLSEQDFDGDITVGDLALDQVEPRVPADLATLPALHLPPELAELDFGALPVKK